MEEEDSDDEEMEDVSDLDEAEGDVDAELEGVAGDEPQAELLEDVEDPQPFVKKDTAPPGAHESVKWFLDEAQTQWRSSWVPGTVLVVDESMVGWGGMGEQELTFIPRKPCDLGMVMKTLVCGSTGVMLVAEIFEGAEKMKKKEFV